MKRQATFALAAASCALAGAFARAAAAGAQLDDVAPPREAARVAESPQNAAVELRFGPYRPRVDEEFAGTGKRPYEQTFGSDARVFVGFEVDWQAVRIPYAGTLGPGFGLGYTHMSAPAKVTGMDELSAEDTTLGILPAYAVGVFRLDVLAREIGIPIVPYGKAGIGHAWWWTGNDLGTSEYKGVVGRGRSWGWHMAAGGMLLLDPLDPHSAVQLDNEMGVNNSYLFFEWVDSNLDGFGSGDRLRVGTRSWILGLAFEM